MTRAVCLSSDKRNGEELHSDSTKVPEYSQYLAIHIACFFLVDPLPCIQQRRKGIGKLLEYRSRYMPTCIFVVIRIGTSLPACLVKGKFHKCKTSVV